MRRIRLYIPQELNLQTELFIEDEQRHHLVNVLRANKHSKLILFNGNGFDYACEIQEFTKKQVHVKIISQTKIVNESKIKTMLLLGISKNIHMDYAIQKAVEAGVSEIQPIATQHTVAKVSSNDKKLHHWNRIVVNACEQCGRAQIPVLHSYIDISSLEKLHEKECGLLFDAESDTSIKNAEFQNEQLIKLLVGPEGGFSSSEVNDCEALGYQKVHLGSHVLRTETAALLAVHSVQLLWG